MDNQNLNQQLPNNFEPEIPKPGQQFEPMTSDPIQHPKKSKKKILLIILLALLLAGGTAAAYFFFFKKEASAPAPSPQASTQQTETKPTGPTALVYSSKVNDKKFNMNWNAIDSATKNIANGDITGEYTSLKDVRKNSIAFTTGNALYLSTDSGKSYKKIKNFDESNFVASIKFSKSGSKLAYNFHKITNNASDSKSTVVTIDVNDPQKESELFTAQDSQAIFIEDWEEGNINRMIYAVGCTQCDGPRTGLYIRDLAKKQSTQLLKGINLISLDNIAVSQNFTSMIYTQATIDKKISTDDLTGYYVGAPYTVSTLNIQNNKITKVGTAGVKATKNSDGSYTYKPIFAGFLANSTTPFYTYEKDLYIAQSEKPSVVFTSSKNIQSILYVNKDVLIGASGDSATDFNTFNYNFASKKSTSLVQSINDSVNLFGVTSND